MRCLGIFATFCVVCCSLLPAEEDVLKVFLASDTETSEENVSTNADIEKMKKTLRIISENAHMKIEMQVFRGKEFTAESLTSWIYSLRDTTGAALFYYVGKRVVIPKHERVESTWPCIPLFLNGRAVYISEETISQRIIRLAPKFSLVLVDCYERELGAVKKISSAYKYPKMSKQFVGLKKLFMNSKGHVMACSGQKARHCFFSSRPRKAGGVFTASFVQGLLQESESRKVCWHTVMDVAKRLCHKEKQEPLIQYFSPNSFKKAKKSL